MQDFASPHLHPIFIAFRSFGWTSLLRQQIAEPVKGKSHSTSRECCSKRKNKRCLCLNSCFSGEQFGEKCCRNLSPAPSPQEAKPVGMICRLVSCLLNVRQFTDVVMAYRYPLNSGISSLKLQINPLQWSLPVS